ncbi:MAG: SDR family oxidoreductase [Steroidobacterales bacterium]
MLSKRLQGKVAVVTGTGSGIGQGCALMFARHGARVTEAILAKLMIKRLGQPEDIAWFATYLVSDEANGVTGPDFRIDGGATAW